MNHNDTSDVRPLLFVFAIMVGSIVCGLAWARHVFWIIGKLTSDGGASVNHMVLGAMVVLVPPVGVVHGFMIWLS